MRAESDKRTVYKTDCSDSISLKKAYKEGKEILSKAGITEADLDAWYLLEFVTGITKARYYMDPDQSMDPEAWKKYKEYLEKRRNHIPLQHITGSQEFMGLEFLVNRYIPSHFPVWWLQVLSKHLPEPPYHQRNSIFLTHRSPLYSYRLLTRSKT